MHSGAQVLTCYVATDTFSMISHAIEDWLCVEVDITCGFYHRSECH